MNNFDQERLKSRATGRKKEFRVIADKIKGMKVREADRIINQLHVDEFRKMDCLDCANCCKTLGPRLTHHDIERMAGFLKTGTSDFFEKYISVDEDKDYVFKSLPCPFLQPDNYCTIYSSRPRACRTYPHTDQKNVAGIIKICLKNTETCPVVFNIFDRIGRSGVK